MDAFLRFLLDNKAWWITPIVIVLVLVAAIYFFDDAGATEVEGAVPFTYDVH